MNKAGLTDKVYEALGGTRVDAERAVDAFVGGIIDSLKNGEEVSISGIGIFEVKIRKGRKGRNPRTGETIQIPEMRVPKFRAAKGLKEAVK